MGAIDEDTMLSDLAELVAIPSVDGTPEEAVVQRWCAERLAGLGLHVDQWEIPVAKLTEDPGFPGMEVERSSLVGCVGVLGDPAELPAMALYGHTDVVPPGELTAWTSSDPFRLRIDAGTAWGRGACDMKAGVAAAFAAVDAIGRSEVQLRRPLAVHLVSAEEDGGAGAFALLRRGHRAAACISAEPTSRTLIPENAGSLTFRLEIPGLATHGSTRRQGVSAIEKLEPVHAALRELEAERNRDTTPLFAHLDLPWPLSIGVVSAGDWASTVPDRLVAEGRYGVRIDETVDDAIAVFEERVAEVCAADEWLRDHPVRVSWPGGMFAPGALPAGHSLLDETRDAVAAVDGRLPAVHGGPYGSDLRHYIRAGVPTVQYGPGEVRFAHAVDERVELADLVRCARVYALMAFRRCT